MFRHSPQLALCDLLSFSHIVEDCYFGVREYTEGKKKKKSQQFMIKKPERQEVAGISACRATAAGPQPAG